MTRSIVKGVSERRTWLDLQGIGAARDLAEFVQRGGLVVFPTESSYALGADPRSADAVATVYRLKRRPETKPLPVVVGSLATLAALGIRDADRGFAGLERAWPGPLTIVLPCARPLPATCGRSELAVRIPGHRRLRTLLSATGMALTATSANRSGEEPVLDPEELDGIVAGEDVVIIDQGRLPGAPPSTVVRWHAASATVLRPGALALARLRQLAPTVEFEAGFSAGAAEIPVEEIS